jgi:hypothetical protein
MINFFKKLFGVSTTSVSTETAPYKVEAPVVEDKVAVVNAQPVSPVAETTPAPKKQAATKKQGSAPKQSAKPRGRKPKTAKQPK